MSDIYTVMVQIAEDSIKATKLIKKARRKMAKFLREHIDFIEDEHVKYKVKCYYVSDINTESLSNSVIQVIESLELMTIKALGRINKQCFEGP